MSLANQRELDIKFVTTEFKKALEDYRKVSTRTLAEILNKKALAILTEAQKETPIANRQKINVLFGTRDKFTRGGKRKINYDTGKYNEHSARNLYIWKMRQKGAALPATESEIDVAAKRMVGRRLGSVGALQWGWNKAIQIITRVVQDAQNVEILKSRGHVTLGSDAIPANPRHLAPFAEWSYRLFNRREGSNHAYIDPRVVDAVTKAFHTETRSMRQHIVDELQKQADKINVK